MTLKMYIPCNPALLYPSTGTYPREIFEDVPKKAYAGMFITALFVIVNLLKQPKCLLTGEWINNLGRALRMDCSIELTCQHG